MAGFIDLLRSHQPSGKKISGAGERIEHARSGHSPPAKKPAKKPAKIAFREGRPVSPKTGGRPLQINSNASPPVRKAIRSAHKPTAKKPGRGRTNAVRATRTGVAAEQGHGWMSQCILLVLAIFRAANRGEPARIDRLAEHIRVLVHSLAKKPENVNLLELGVSRGGQAIRGMDRDLGDLVEKSITMMLYAVKTGLHFRLNESGLKTLILAAMLHHIGMARVSAITRHKPEKLNAVEREHIGLAPKQGAAYLLSCGVRDQRILTAASQARERFDGSGGPEGLKGAEISRTARIVGLLSMFEALIHFRAYHRRLLPRDAIRELIVHHKAAFDPAMLKGLIESVSLYPVGTYVQLNSGDIGQVIRVHRRLPLRPVVRLLLDRHGNSIEPRNINLQTQSNLIVERCMYMEDLSGTNRRPSGAA